MDYPTTLSGEQGSGSQTYTGLYDSMASDFAADAQPEEWMGYDYSSTGSHEVVCKI